MVTKASGPKHGDQSRHLLTCWSVVQGLQPPLVAHGLLQHETKLSVLNFAVKKDAHFSETLQNKTELLFVTGLR